MSDFLFLLLAIFLVGLQGWYIAVYLTSFLELKFSRKRFFLLCILAVLSTKITVNNGTEMIEFRYMIFLIIACLVVFCFFGSIVQKMFHYFYIVFLFLFQNKLLVLSQGKSDPDEVLIQFIFSYSSITILAILIVGFLYYFKNSNEIGLENREYLMLSVAPFLSILLFMYPFDFSVWEEIFFSLAMMGINMMNIFLYNYLTEKTYLLQQQILVGAQNQHYEDVLKKQQELRTLKHDLKNLLLGLNYHVYNENLEEAKLLLKEITAGSIDTYVSYTECWPIDTILSSKISQMKKQNVQFALELKVPVDLTIDDKVVDICAILGNILDNAIEECVRIESELQINICIYYHEKKLIFKVTNPTNIKDLNISNKLIKSSKKRGRYGLGINSIRERVKRLKGYSDFSWKANEFKVIIVLPIG
ncbi:sensor histidine kinase [Enterococcus sp. AZ192]|uniref:sensor histidine kinase n=1 Tax=unclassified Enterococcus TaxID=2608891 RepID=UPI003D279CFE